ncbi:MAG: DJ-1/PfpI family protein [Propionibacteriaceae bacterium]|jgi:transcriptional regulator GlxA family with amidase domain|nr:DJ-1/PfpI family protein [Propionibacteriaceae bacterium]
MIESERRQVQVVLFDGFELLDLCGPLEVFGLADRFETTLIGPEAGPVASSQGTKLLADRSYADAPPPDIVLVPGGPGTRSLVLDQAWLGWLADWAAPADLIAAVCTGSALLAAAGLLEGRRATSNRRAFAWVSRQGRQVTWLDQVRWVEDHGRWTSAGVSAGLDLSLALVRRLCGDVTAREVATRMEYDWRDAAAEQTVCRSDESR